MSESSFCEELRNFNYENCIVTHNEDSGDSSSHFSLHISDSVEKEQTVGTNPDEVDTSSDSFMDFSCAQLADLDLNAGDTFVFMLGMLNRIEKYLNKLEKEDQKDWLQKQILILKTALIKNSYLFKISEVRDINGTIYISKNEPKKKKKKKVAKKFKTVEGQSMMNQLKGEAESEIGAGDNVKHTLEPELHEGLLETVNNCLELTQSHSRLNNTKLNRRQSQRLQNFSQDRKVPCYDRLACVSLKLESFKSTQSQEPNTKNCGTSMKQSTKSKNLGEKVLSKSACEVKTWRMQRNRRVTVSRIKAIKKGKEQNAQNNNVINIIERKAKSLGLGGNLNRNDSKPTVPKITQKQNNGEKIHGKKKRAASLDGRVSKKAKKALDNVTVPQQPETNQPGSSSTSSGKRKLYAEDTWLHSFGTFYQTTPPYT